MHAKMKEVRCALVGYGGAFSMGKLHGDQINAAPGMRITAACDIDPKRMQTAAEDFPGIATYTDVKALLKDPNVDLCVLILPHNLHAPVALQCLKAGKHVVLEKPMCLSTAEAKAMIALAKQNDLMVTVYHNRRHDGDFKALRQAIADGLLGEVFEIEMWGGGYGAPGKWWRSNKEISGGCMYDWGAHFVDWILNLIPEKIENVTGFFQKRVWMDTTNEDQTQAIIRFKNGATADLQVSSIARVGKPKFRILGTKGAIIDEWKGSFKLYTQVDGIPVEGEIKYKNSTWPEYYQNLAAHMLDGAPLEVTPESSRRVIGVIETAGKSAKSGRSEKVEFE